MRRRDEGPGTREFDGLSFADASWPNPPALAEAVSLSDAQLDALSAELSARWRGAVAR